MLVVPRLDGLLGETMEGGTKMSAFVPVYRNEDADRGLRRRIWNRLMSHGFRENLIMDALYS